MKNYTDEIIAKFPNLTCSVLNGGVNVYYHKYVITIWWRKQSYCDTAKQKWVRFTSLEAIIGVIEQAAYPNREKVVPAPSKTPIMDYVNVSKTGVELCILHIQNKISTVEKNNPNNAVLTVLKQLVFELNAYL